MADKESTLWDTEGWKWLTTLARLDGAAHFFSLAGKGANKTKEQLFSQPGTQDILSNFLILLSIIKICRISDTQPLIISVEKKIFIAFAVD